MLEPQGCVSAFACSAWRNKGVGSVAEHDAGSMNEQCLMETACKCKDQHQGIVESERAHGMVTIQCTLALGEVLVRNKQAAVAVINITYDVLVTAVRQLIDHRIAIASIKLAN